MTTKFAGNYEGPLYAPHPDIQKKKFKMKLFDFHKKDDEYIFTLIKGKRRSFLQFSYYWMEKSDGFFLQIGFGNNRFVDVLFWCWKIGFAFELFGITWSYYS